MKVITVNFVDVYIDGNHVGSAKTATLSISDNDIPRDIIIDGLTAEKLLYEIDHNCIVTYKKKGKKKVATFVLRQIELMADTMKYNLQLSI